MTKAAAQTVSANFDLFWSENEATGCWEWRGAKSKGYGSLKVKGRTMKAYRFSFERTNGPIPDGAHVLHDCDNCGCVNPAHLRLGTHADNMKDRTVRGRFVPPFGERAHHAKLKQVEVDTIRRLVSSGMLQREAALMFNTTQSNVSDICLGKSWPSAETNA